MKSLKRNLPDGGRRKRRRKIIGTWITIKLEDNKFRVKSFRSPMLFKSDLIYEKILSSQEIRKLIGDKNYSRFLNGEEIFVVYS